MSVATLLTPVRAVWDPLEGAKRVVEARAFVGALMLLAVSVASSHAVAAAKWDPTPVVVAQLQAKGELKTTTDQDLDKQIRTEQRVKIVLGTLGGLFLAPLYVLLVASALKLLGWLLGTRGPFSAHLSAAAFASVPIALFHLLAAALALWGGRVGSPSPAELVPSHLGVLFPHAAPPLSNLFEAVDFFQLWGAGLLCLGFRDAVAPRTPRTWWVVPLVLVTLVILHQKGAA